MSRFMHGIRGLSHRYFFSTRNVFLEGTVGRRLAGSKRGRERDRLCSTSLRCASVRRGWLGGLEGGGGVHRIVETGMVNLTTVWRLLFVLCSFGKAHLKNIAVSSVCGHRVFIGFRRRVIFFLRCTHFSVCTKKIQLLLQHILNPKSAV